MAPLIYFWVLGKFLRFFSRGDTIAEGTVDGINVASKDRKHFRVSLFLSPRAPQTQCWTLHLGLKFQVVRNGEKIKCGAPKSTLSLGGAGGEVRRAISVQGHTPQEEVAVADFTGNKSSVNCLRLPQKL